MNRRFNLFDLKSINLNKFYIVSFLIFAFISNLQVLTQENKFNNLYKKINEIQIIGTVISDRTDSEYKSSYIINVQSVNSNKKFKGTNLIIYIPKTKELEYGDKIILDGVYEKAKCAKNYKEFDYREYLKSKNIYGIVNAESVKVLKKNNLNFVLIAIDNLRGKIKSNLRDILGEEAELTIRNTTPEIYQKYQTKLYKILKIVAFIIF